jgi:F-type H+-transporting ATPase subunit c
MARSKVVVILLVSLLLLTVAIPMVYAQEGEEAKGGDFLKKFGLAIGAGLGMGLAAFGGGLGQGRTAASALEGIARNPGASDKMFVPMIIGLALIESLVLYTFIIAIFLQAKI